MVLTADAWLWAHEPMSLWAVHLPLLKRGHYVLLRKLMKDFLIILKITFGLPNAISSTWLHFRLLAKQTKLANGLWIKKSFE